MQRAIRMVRRSAAEWGVDPARVGVMGFSAGGELAVMAAERYDVDAAGTVAGQRQPTLSGETGKDGPPDAIDKESGKPAFEALRYPWAAGGRACQRWTKDMPPGFLLCGADDRDNIAQALPELFLAMKKAGVSAELHEYAGVGHRLWAAPEAHGGVAEWPEVFVQWMDTKGFLRGK